MEKDEITLEAYSRLSDEERELVRLEAAESHLESKLAALHAGSFLQDLALDMSEYDAGMIRNVAVHCQTDRTTVEKVIASFARLIANDVATTGKASFPGIGVIRESAKSDDRGRVLSVDVSVAFGKGTES